MSIESEATPPAFTHAPASIQPQIESGAPVYDELSCPYCTEHLVVRDGTTLMCTAPSCGKVWKDR